MPKALILGVGAAQVDAITHLKNMGWEVIGCSYRREGPGLKLVDKFVVMDITDVNRLIMLGREEKIDLVYSIGSDLAMPTVARVASALKLPRLVNPEIAELLQNKIALRGWLTRHRLSTLAYRAISHPADLAGWKRFPAILKPADAQGQRGVWRVNDLPTAIATLPRVLDFSRSRRAIIEEFIVGAEVSANVFVTAGQVVFNQITDRLVVEDHPGGIPRGHVCPSRTCQGPLLAATRDLVAKTVQTLRVENGPLYFQIKLSSTGPQIIEVAPRLDGCHLWRLIAIVTGVNLLAATFQSLLRERVNLPECAAPHTQARLTFLLGPPGSIFRSADYPVPLTCAYKQYYFSDGDVVCVVNGFLEKVGYYIELER